MRWDAVGLTRLIIPAKKWILPYRTSFADKGGADSEEMTPLLVMGTHREGSAVRSHPQTDVPQLPFLWTRGTAAREILYYLDGNGMDAAPVGEG